MTSFDRSNITFFVRRKIDEDTIIPDLMATGCLRSARQDRYGGVSIHDPSSKNLEFAGCTIIYVRKIDLVDYLCKDIGRYVGNHRVGGYHAKLSEKRKRETHEGFLDGSIHCVVATIAFGMGVDKPDVRYVIHNEPPGQPEAYYQVMTIQSNTHLRF